jgi:hypothetical protein
MMLESLSWRLTLTDSIELVADLRAFIGSLEAKEQRTPWEDGLLNIMKVALDEYQSTLVLLALASRPQPHSISRNMTISNSRTARVITTNGQHRISLVPKGLYRG